MVKMRSMLTMRGVRLVALSLTLGLLGGLPVLAGGTSSSVAGTFALTGPANGAFVSGVVPVSWNWSGGSQMRNRFVALSTLQSGNRVKIISLAVPMWHGQQLWDTRNWPDGRYALRGLAVGTPLQSFRYNLYVDNTPPAVQITAPAPGSITVGDPRNGSLVSISHEELPATLVAGPTVFEAAASDNLSGVRAIRWYLNDAFAGEGASVRIDFEAMPGEHVVTAVAVDAAGNENSSSLAIYAIGTELPGDLPGLPGLEDLPEPPGDLPSLPDPGDLPDLPGLDDLPGLPGLDDLPDPSDLPDPPGVPDPSEPGLPGLPVPIP